MKTVKEFSELAGVSRQAVQKAVQAGRLNRTNGKIDETDNLSVEYLSAYNPSSHRKTATQAQTPRLPYANTDGRAAVDLEKAKQQTIHWQLRNAKERGLLIDRELVAKAVEITDSEHKRLLADGCQTWAKVAFDIVKSGGSREEVVDALRDEVSSSLKAWKRQISRQLKFFYDE